MSHNDIDTSDFYANEQLLTDDERATLRAVRKFMTSEVTPVLLENWSRATFPIEIVPGSRDLGIAGQRPLRDQHHEADSLAALKIAVRARDIFEWVAPADGHLDGSGHKNFGMPVSSWTNARRVVRRNSAAYSSLLHTTSTAAEHRAILIGSAGPTRWHSSRRRASTDGREADYPRGDLRLTS